MRKDPESFLVFMRGGKDICPFAGKELPHIDGTEASVACSKDSAVGCDGVPHYAYIPLPSFSATPPQNSINKLSQYDPKMDLEKLNTQLSWFAPEGEFVEEQTKVVSSAGNLHTIVGSN